MNVKNLDVKVRWATVGNRTPPSGALRMTSTARLQLAGVRDDFGNWLQLGPEARERA